MKTRTSPTTLEARRAAVAVGLLQKKSFRQLGAELGVTSVTIMKDRNVLRAAWRQSYGQVQGCSRISS